MWDLKKSATTTDVKLQSLQHHDALLSDGYTAHPRKESSSNSEHHEPASKHPRWKVGTRYCALSASLVFLMNLIFLLAGEGRSGFPALNSGEGKRTLYDGRCDTTKKMNIGVHLLINILSTMLLGASNYCMQCMSAPTRAEADMAHAKFRWVDIGIPSIRNLTRVRGLRVFLWLILGISSLPLHLFYNSAVYSSITANEYMVFSANEAFVDATSTSYTPVGTVPENVVNRLFTFAQNKNLERLSSSECVNAYAQNYQSARGSVLLVVSNTTEGFTDGAAIDYQTQVAPITSLDNSAPDPFAWICEQFSYDGVSCGTKIEGIRNKLDAWQPFGRRVEYCMTEKIEQHCRLVYSVHLVILVVLIGLLKTVTMLYVAFKVHDAPMLTIGDAITSFLNTPDAKTKGMCLLDRSLRDYKSRTNPRLSIVDSGTYSSIGWIAPPKQFRNVRRRHFSAASVRRWLTFLATFVVAIGVSIFLLIYGVYFWKNDSKSDVYSQGIGTVDPRAFITWSIPTTGVAGLLCNVLVANAPQLVLSFLYLNYNGLMTVMSLAHEWARYGIRRNGLRVSKTTSGAQRSTYFLQLPYRFGVPIIVVTGTLHWLISQSIFLVSVEAIEFLAHANDEDTVIWDTENPRYLMTCGYSPPAILASIIVLFLLFIWIVSIGFVKLPSSMPVAASCSAAIAAACHLPAEQLEENAAEAELMWGEMEKDEKEIGHCGFSMYEVRQPVDGKLYA